jgi:hypothetical protein
VSCWTAGPTSACGNRNSGRSARWTTQEDNHRARLLYDKVARLNGFIRYDYAL